MTETQLYYELIHSCCPPLSRERNSIVLRMETDSLLLPPLEHKRISQVCQFDSLLVPTSARQDQNKLNASKNGFVLGAHLCSPGIEEIEFSEVRFTLDAISAQKHKRNTNAWPH